MLRRLRAAIDGAVAGAAVGTTIMMLLIVKGGMNLDRALPALWIAGGVGLVLGLAFGRRGGKRKESEPP